MKDIKTLVDLFAHTLRDMHHAEKQIRDALPDMIAKGTDPMLRQGLQKHLEETRGHIARLEDVFRRHGVSAKEFDCPAVDGILEEAGAVAGEIEDKKVLDTALIAAAQAVEHYEMTRCGTLVEWAKQLGRTDCAVVLKQNLGEQKATARKLTEFAESEVNLATAEQSARRPPSGTLRFLGAAVPA
ncbi:MAG TPA: ferritin-like domain-containing protein, partial [Rhizobiales bacterium]|nr:ferritin-like domain-containing protein [Hyphomicrobiales bacterium]